MGGDLPIWDLVRDTSPVVQGVLAILVFASVLSWSIIFRKRFVIRRAKRIAEKFEADFWSGGDLTTLYRGLEAKGRDGTGIESIFGAGFREFNRLRQQQQVPADQLLEGARRAMRVALMRELERLEQSLATLATVGSTSPYVGLFGTVWGIMSAFHGLGDAKQATLAMVAPGISEALVATAAGLFAAIPAVIAYNRFADQVGRLQLRYDAFMEEFSSILQRHAHAASRGPTG
jgi:biopolymer transport protein TolQ